MVFVASEGGLVGLPGARRLRQRHGKCLDFQQVAHIALHEADQFQAGLLTHSFQFQRLVQGTQLAAQGSPLAFKADG
ncbi:hypothetical protein D3C76_1258970 [compost metagenome]